MTGSYRTAGEFLYWDILSRFGDNWEKLETDLRVTGRADCLSQMFKEISAVNLAGRVVAAGTFLAKKYDISSPLFESEYRQFLNDYLLIPPQEMAKFQRLSTAAVKASFEEISASVRSRVTRSSKESGGRCYMCGVPLIFNDDNSHKAFTLDHLWPRSYGGNSEQENLLPACLSCNSNKKKNFASWAMPSIQALILGPKEASHRLQEIEGSYKFALHYKHVQHYSKKMNISLQRAFVEVGPWVDIRIIDEDDTCDFFNLSNFNPHIRRGYAN